MRAVIAAISVERAPSQNLSKPRYSGHVVSGRPPRHRFSPRWMVILAWPRSGRSRGRSGSCAYATGSGWSTRGVRLMDQPASGFISAPSISGRLARQQRLKKAGNTAEPTAGSPANRNHGPTSLEGQHLGQLVPAEHIPEVAA